MSFRHVHLWVSLTVATALPNCSDDTQAHESSGGSSETGTEPEVIEPDGSEYVYDESRLRSYRVEVAPNDWQEALRLLSEDPDPNDGKDPPYEIYIPARVHVDGETIENVGLRFKGNYSLSACHKAEDPWLADCRKISVRLKFNHYNKEQRFHGVKRLNFHSNFGDDSQLRERLAYSLYRDFGVAAPRVVHARLEINQSYKGRRFEGLFSLVEAIDGRFTRQNFGLDSRGGEGNLYKEVWPMYTAPEPYLEALRTNEDEFPDVSGMIELATLLHGLTTEQFRYEIPQRIDYTQLLKTLAVDRAIGNWDSWVTAWYCMEDTDGRRGSDCQVPISECKNKNFYWYEGDKLTLIPWDMNDTFSPNLERESGGQGDLPHWTRAADSCAPICIWGGWTAVRPAVCDPLIAQLGSTAWEEYVEHSLEFLGAHYNYVRIHEKIQRWAAQIEPEIARDLELGDGPEAWQRGMQELERSVLQKISDINYELAVRDKAGARSE